MSCTWIYRPWSLYIPKLFKLFCPIPFASLLSKINPFNQLICIVAIMIYNADIILCVSEGTALLWWWDRNVKSSATTSTTTNIITSVNNIYCCCDLIIELLFVEWLYRSGAKMHLKKNYFAHKFFNSHLKQVISYGPK